MTAANRWAKKKPARSAALPIWMKFMKAAIAGKDDEQFPGGDEPDGGAMEVSAKPPASLKLNPSVPGAINPESRPDYPSTRLRRSR